ncbi:MAG TPA: DUF1059 domain-containing protein [Myxococcales bacterium]|jgi:predicted small metal-binding protein
MENRETLDCRRFPTSSGCTLRITGTRDEVLRAGLAHAQAVHGERDTPQMRMELERAMEPEGPIAAQPGRKLADCRTIPGEITCTLAISGQEDEVVRMAVDHAVADHKHELNQELVRSIRDSLKDESRYASEGAGAPA